MDNDLTDVWAPVRGYEGRYEISSSGLIRTASRDIVGTDGALIKHLEATPIKTYMNTQISKEYVLLYNGQKYDKVYIDDLINNQYL